MRILYTALRFPLKPSPLGGKVDANVVSRRMRGNSPQAAAILRPHQSPTVLSLATGIPLTVDDAEAITKSWPNFFEAIKPLGAEVEYA